MDLVLWGGLCVLDGARFDDGQQSLVVAVGTTTSGRHGRSAGRRGWKIRGWRPSFQEVPGDLLVADWSITGRRFGRRRVATRLDLCFGPGGLGPLPKVFGDLGQLGLRRRSVGSGGGGGTLGRGSSGLGHGKVSGDGRSADAEPERSEGVLIGWSVGFRPTFRCVATRSVTPRCRARNRHRNRCSGRLRPGHW